MSEKEIQDKHAELRASNLRMMEFFGGDVNRYAKWGYRFRIRGLPTNMHIMRPRKKRTTLNNHQVSDRYWRKRIRENRPASTNKSTIGVEKWYRRKFEAEINDP